MNICILHMNGSIEDVNIISAALDSFADLIPKDLVYSIIVHDHAFRSGLIQPSAEANISLYPPKYLKRMKNHSDEVLSLSARLATCKSESEKYIAVYQLLVEPHSKIKTDCLAAFNGYGYSSSKTNRLWWTSVFNPCDGYGSSAEQMLNAIDRYSKVDVIFKPHLVLNPHLAMPNVKRLWHFGKKFSPKRGELVDMHYLCYTQPHERPIPLVFKGKTINFTMWESDCIPKMWPQLTKKFTEVWTPSEWGVRKFKEYGITRPVRAIPLGVNTEIFKYKKRSEPKGPFKFLMYANAHWENSRKNYQLVYDAFKKAFGNRADVQLTLKLNTGTNKGVGKNVNVIAGNLKTTELAELLHDHDCFLFVSSGEGWGLPPREAISTGCPTIVGNSSALEDLAKSEYSIPVEPTGVRPVYGYGPIHGKLKDLGVFDDFRVDDIVDAMRWVYNNYPEAVKRAKRGSEYISNTQTYEHTAKAIEEALKA